MKSVIPLLYFILLISGVSVAQIPTNHLKLWLQADQNVTYTTTVSAWNDCSGNSNNAIQATASKQPTYTSVNAGINNKPALTFDGTNDEMLGTTITDINLNSMSVFIVARNNSLPSTGSARGMFSVGAYGSGGFELMRGSAGQFGYYQKSSNFNSGNTDDCSTDGTPFRVYCATKQVGTISKIYVNSVFRSSSTLANIISTFTNAAYKIGYFSLSPYYWNGQIAEIVVYDTLLTDTQRLQVETYLMDKYTPVFSLGSDINIGYGFCDTTLSVPSGFSNILWSTGATTQSIQVHTSGTYFVQARDNFNRMRYDTIQVSFPQVVLPNSTICLGDSVFYEVNLSGSYTYLWSDNSTSSSAYFHTEGLHSVQISDTNSCSLTPAFFVDVDSFPQRIDLGTDTSLCSGNQIRLIVGENLCSTFLWLPGNETTPQRTVTESGLYKLTATNTNGCTASDSLFVSIQGLAPTPVFTVDNLCFGDVVQCNDFSVHPDSIQSFTWIFNATDTLYSQNPQYQFAAPGTHSIRLVLESFSGCVNDSVAQVVVKPLPEVSFSWLPVCAGIPVDFEAETQVPSGVNIVAWNWFVNGVSEATTENFSYTFPENGSVAVELIVEADNACYNSFDTLVNVAGSYPIPEYLSLISPSDNYFASVQNVNFVWNIADNALFYELILSESADFTDELFHSDRLFVTEYVFSLPASFDTIYWKVVAFNPCLESMTSEVHRLIDFNPGWIPSVKLWVNADNTVITDGKVTQLTDMSGNNFHLTQSNTTNAPTKIGNQLAGYPVIRFNGTNNYMTTSFGQPFAQPNTFFVIFKLDDNAIRYVYDGLIGFNSLRYNSGELQMRAGSSVLGYTRSAPFGFVLSRQVFNGANSKLFENGQLKQSGTLTVNTLSGMTLGSLNSLGNYYFKGDIAELIYCNAALTEAEVSSVRQYLSNKYAQPVNLGPDIRISYGFCDTAISTANKPWFTSFQWSTGETTPVITVNRSGVYTVTVTDMFGFQSSDDIRVFYPEVQEFADTIVCLGQQVVWETNVSGNYSFSWYGSSETGSSLNINVPGNYAAIVSDTLGCHYLSDTISFGFDYYETEASVGPADTIICTGNTLQLLNHVSQTVSYLWNTGAVSPGIVISEPGQYSVITTNWRNCTAYDTIQVAIKGIAPVPGFDVLNLCTGQPTLFTNESYHPDSIQSYQWVINHTDTLQTPDISYTFASPGNHDVELFIETYSGCTADTLAVLNIQTPPVPSFTYYSLCAGVEMDFVAQPGLPPGSEVNAYRWYVDGVLSGSESILPYTFAGDGHYQLRLEVDLNNLCSAAYEESVNVVAAYPNPEYLSLITPPNGYIYSEAAQQFVWNMADNALFYEFQVSADATFASLLYSSGNITSTSYNYDIPVAADTIYWRVLAYNPCNVLMQSEQHLMHRFSPASIPGLSLWVHADSVQIVNGKIAQIDDQSGNNYDLTQATDANRPVKVTNQLAGHPVMRFNGTSNFLTTDFGQSYAQPNTVFSIFKMSDGQSRYLYDGTDGFHALRYVGGDLEMRVGSGSLGYTRSVISGFILSEQIFNTTNSKMFENGQLKKSGTLPAGSLSGFKLGTYNVGGNYYFKGDLAELVLFNRVLSDSETASLRQYFSNKYSEPVNLGPDIRIAYGFCDTSIVNAYKPWFTSYQWSTGETDSVITVNRSGVYTVTVTDMFGFQSSDDIRVFYPEFQEFADTIVCLGQQVVWETNVSGNYSFSWYGSSETGSSLSISVPGNYAVIVSDTLGCQYLSDTISFGFDYYETEASVGPADTIICTGNTLQLLNLVPQTVSYLWNTGSVLPGIVISEPGQYSVITTNWRNCIAYDTIQVAIKGIAPVPGFDVLNLCTGQPTLFTNGSYHPDSIQSYQWVINHTDTLQTPDISYTFATPGNHDVELFIETFSGCTADTLAVLNIQSPPVPSFTYYSLCAGVEMDFVAQAGLPPGSEVSAYRWYVDGVMSGSESILPYTFAGDGHYQLRLEVDLNNLCSAAYEESVNVVAAYPNPEYLSLITPPNGYIYSEPAQQFVWNMADNALFYEFQVSADANFEVLLHSSGNITATSYSYDIPETNDTIYWRVLAYNPCNVLMQSEQHLMHRFSPVSIPGLSLWIHADSVQIVNGKIAQIDDQSGNNYDLTQATDANRPVKVTNQLAGHPVMRFNGTSNFLTTDFGQSYAQPNSIFSIFKMSDGQSRYLYDGNTGFHALRYVGGDLEMRVGTTTLGYPRSVISGFILSEQIFNTTNSKMFENGQLKKSGTLPEGSLSGFKLGTYNVGGNYYFKGDLAELVLFNRVLSDSETASLRQYFSNKYSEPVNLGPDIRIAYGFCDTTIVTAYKPWFTSYQWSTGETDSVIHVNQPGIYSVTVTDMFGFQSSDYIQVFYPRVHQINDTVLCMGAEMTWSTGLDNSYQYLWLGSTGTNPSITISSPDDYAVVVSDTLGCKYYSDTVTVAYSYYASYASVGPADTIMCSGSKLHLVAGAEETIYYIWNTGSTSYDMTVVNEGTYSVTVFNTYGCTAFDVIDVSLEGFAPNPQFVSEGICAMNPVVFTDMSDPVEGSIDSWQWIIDGQTISSVNTFDHVFETPGVHNVRLLVSNTGNCSNYTDGLVTIRAIPVPDFTPKMLCSRNTTLFSSTSNPGEGTISDTYWRLDSGETSDTTTLLHQFTDPGTYTVFLKAQNSFGCTDSINFDVQVRPSPTAGFTTSDICEGIDMYFVNTSQPVGVWDITGYSWSFGDGAESAVSNPSHNYPVAGLYDVSLSVNALNGCSDTLTQTVKVHAIPVAEFSGLNACVGVPHTVLSNAGVANGIIVSWEYQLDDSVQFTVENPAFILNQTGNHSMWLRVISDGGCTDTVAHDLTVHPLPEASFTVDYTWGAAPFAVEFTNETTGADNYLWEFGDESFSYEQNPQHVFDSAGVYYVSMTAFSAQGCVATAQTTLQALETILDIALLNLSTEVVNNYLVLSCDIINAGALPVSDLDLVVTISPNIVIREKLNASLFQGSVMHHVFSNQFYLYSGNLPASVCVEAVVNDYPGLEDINPENQVLCKFSANGLLVYEPFPNPADEFITLDMVNPSGMAFDICIYNALGMKLFSESYDENSGRAYHLNLSTKDFPVGLYNIVISQNGYLVSKQFIKL